MTTSTKAIPIIILALLFAVGACSNDNDTDVDEASATAPTVEVNFSFGQKTFGDYDYEFVDATMRGTVERDDGSTGEYAVPVKLAYPVGGGNGLGVVDLVNDGVFRGSQQAHEGNPHACVRGEDPMFCHELEGDSEGRRVENRMVRWADRLTGGSLLRQGYTYMALQPGKATLDHMGPERPVGYRRHRLVYGFIEEPVDQFKVIQEASRWLHDPSNFEGEAAPDAAPMASNYLIASGFSASSNVNLQLDEWNQSESGLHYDGFVWAGVGMGCTVPREDWPYLEIVGCPFIDDFFPWQTGGAKVLYLTPENDMVMAPDHLARDPGDFDPEVDPNPDYRVWEIPGTSHLSAAEMNTTPWGAEAPLQTSFAPVMRAAFHHMEDWLKDDMSPPPSSYMEGDEVDVEAFPPPHIEIDDEIDEEAIDSLGLLVIDRDDDGNALGGVRLPFLPRELDDGTTVGTPVGRYIALVLEYLEKDPPNLLAAISGTFERFSDEELAERYPTREDYLERYEAALDQVIAEGYVLEEDRDRLLARAGEVAIPEAPEAADMPDAAEECIGHACPGETDIDLPEGGVVRLELVHQGDWAPEVRTSAWFAGDQTPDTRPFTRPPEHWHIQDGEDLCRDLREDDFFPGGDVERRTYLDAGEAVQFVTESTEISLPRVKEGQDDATWQWHDILYRDHIPAAHVAAGADYDVAIAGGEDLSETTYEGALHLPEDFQLAFPNMDDVVIMPAGRDFRFLTEDRPDPHAFDYTFVSFADKFGAIGLCIGPPSQHITVPAEFLEAMPPGGMVQFGFFNHQVEELDGRRIDFIGVNSREARYLIDDEYLLDVNPE